MVTSGNVCISHLGLSISNIKINLIHVCLKEYTGNHTLLSISTILQKKEEKYQIKFKKKQQQYIITQFNNQYENCLSHKIT